MQKILPGAPWLIAHQSMLTENQPKKLTLNGKNYVIWQNSQGKISALSDVCPHWQAPLSNGWISQNSNTLICPFHGLEFDEQGRLCHEGKGKGQPLVTPLKLHLIGDWIWTYGECTPKKEIPDLLLKIPSDYTFWGVCGEQTIESKFVNCLKINYDFNHVLATHKTVAKFSHLQVKQVEFNQDKIKVTQEVFLQQNAWTEILRKPALLASPSHYTNHFEYFFPSVTLITTKIKALELLQFIIIYPESETKTKTYAVLYGKINHKLLVPFQSLIKRTLLKDFAVILTQDAKMLASLYPSEKSKIQLPHEEITNYVEMLYNEWN